MCWQSGGRSSEPCARAHFSFRALYDIFKTSAGMHKTPVGRRSVRGFRVAFLLRHTRTHVPLRNGAFASFHPMSATPLPPLSSPLLTLTCVLQNADRVGSAGAVCWVFLETPSSSSYVCAPGGLIVRTRSCRPTGLGCVGDEFLGLRA